MKILPLAAALLALMMLPALAQEQDPIRHGRRLAKEFCARCHSIDKRRPSPRREAPPLRKIARNYDLDHFVGVMLRGISTGHPDMPRIKFSAQDARDLRDYLRTIQE